VTELVSELDNRWGSDVLRCCCEKLVAEAGDITGNRRWRTSAVGSRYRATAREDVTVDTSVCLYMSY
jgi:hypothetical protein